MDDFSTESISTDENFAHLVLQIVKTYMHEKYIYLWQIQ